MKVFGVVYLIVNKVNGKMYVGQTTQLLEERFKEHAHCKKTVIGRAIRKYGKENFCCEALKYCESKEDLDAWEKFFIAALRTKLPIGYNLTDGGGGIVGWHHKPESCAKISAKKLGKQLSPEHCANISISKRGKNHPWFGKSLPLEHCINMSKGRRGKSLYKNLIAELDAHQFSYSALAKLLNVKPHTVSRKMSGKRNFTARDKVWLEKFFGKPIEYLLERDGG